MKGENRCCCDHNIAPILKKFSSINPWKCEIIFAIFGLCIFSLKALYLSSEVICKKSQRCFWSYISKSQSISISLKLVPYYGHNYVWHWFPPVEIKKPSVWSHWYPCPADFFFFFWLDFFLRRAATLKGRCLVLLLAASLGRARGFRG